MNDVIIIGVGPAGLSAATYAGRAGLKTTMFGILENSNAYKAHIIENYFGFAEALSGPDLMNAGKKQAERFGAVHVAREVTDMKRNDDGTFTVIDSAQEVYHSKTLIISSGLGFKPSGISQEKKFTGKGVSFCVTCDGFFFKNKPVCVIGSGHFAGEEALQLLSYTSDVTILSHGKKFSFGEKMEEGLTKKGVKMIETQKVSEFLGAEKLEGVKFKDNTEMKFDGVFLALGIATAGDFANKLGIERTGPMNAFLVADSRTGETNVPGIYAAGDCIGGNAQAAKSAGEGCNAAISVIKKVKGVAAYVDYD